MRSIKRIVKIHEINGYRITCLFNNGESRIIDFKDLFEKWKITKEHIAFPLLMDINEFQKVKLIDGTLVWKNIKFKSQDEKGNEVIRFFDLDPIVLYQNSVLDKSRTLSIGLMIKQIRGELGLTQNELASRTGTSKHYISRIENEKSDIELMTLKKIVEGLGKKLLVTIK